MGEKGNPLDFVGELPSSVLSSLPDIAKAYKEWQQKVQAEEAGAAVAAPPVESPPV